MPFPVYVNPAFDKEDEKASSSKAILNLSMVEAEYGRGAAIYH